MRFKQYVRLGLGLMVLGLALPAFAQTPASTPASTPPATPPAFTTPRPSPAAKVQQTVGTTELSLSYSRPGVKGRVIWGELVPWNQPWRTGANEPNQFTCSDDVMVEGQKLAAGTYSLITIPAAESWTVAFSSQKDLQGSTNYDAKSDALRIMAKPVMSAESVERMQFTFDDPTDESVTLALRWEKLALPIKFTVDTKGKVLASARTAVAAAKADDWNTPYRAATWAHTNGVAADEAAQWAAAAAKSKENFQTAGLLARMAQKTGDMKNAVVLMKKSIAFGKADTNVAKEQVATNEKMLEEWTAKKK